MEHLTDESLMELIQDGNRDAFTVLVNRNSKYYFAIVYRFVGNRELAEDILQTAFLKLWEKPYQFDAARASFKTWFARGVVNICIDDRRARKYVKNIDDFEIADHRMSAPDMIEKRHKYQVLQNAINKLSANYRTAINLGVINEMQYCDVAKIMKKSEGAVKVLINRGREQLRNIIKGGGYEL